MLRVLQKAPPPIIQSLLKMLNSEGGTLEYNFQKVNIFACVAKISFSRQLKVQLNWLYYHDKFSHSFSPPHSFRISKYHTKHTPGLTDISVILFF